MRTAYSYVRFSTPDQAKGHSLARQKEASEKWCAEHGYTLAKDLFFDRGKSGWKGEHLQAKGELKRFLGLVENGTITSGSVLIVENFDRLSRLKPVQSYSLFLNLINAGIGLVFTLSYDTRVITEELLNKEPGLLQMILGECIRANAESARKSEIVSKAKQDKLARIRNGEKVPHNNVPKYFVWDSGKREYGWHPINVPLVQRMVSDFLAGQSLYGIAKTFNREEIRTFRRGFQWSAVSVRAILRNRALVGEYLGRKDYLPLIVDMDDFNRVQVILSQNTNKRGKEAELANIFRGLAFCICGASMNVLSQSVDYRRKKNWGQPYRYLRCSTKAAGKICCSKHIIRLDQLERQFFALFLLEDPRAMVTDTDNSEAEALNAAMAASHTRIATLTQQITKLATVNEGIAAPELKNQIMKLVDEREEERATLDKISLQRIATEHRPKQFDDLKALFEGIFETDAKKSVRMTDYADAVLRLTESLTDNAVRKKAATILPTLIGRLVVNTEKGTFEVFNRTGEGIYKSVPIKSIGPFRNVSTGRFVPARLNDGASV